MENLKVRPAGLASLLVALSMAGVARDGWAQMNFGFEPPTYTTGDLVGQDGWVKNTYYGEMNGTVSVSNSSPLVGSQSIHYVQTAAGGSSDVGRFGAMLVPAIQGTDVTVSYVIQASSSISGPNSGVFFGAGAPGGASPILARINGGVIEVGSALAFVPVSEFFFLENERIKMTYEIDFNSSSMNLILENLDFSDIFSQSYPFFDGYGAPTGPNGEYVLDMGVFFRGGDVRIDDITFTAGVGPLDATFEWTAAGSGNWNQPNNWTPNGVAGTLPGRQKVTLGGAISATQTIYNNSARNLNALEFDNANSYIVAGVGSLAFQSDTSGETTVAPTISVLSGAHQIQLAVELVDDTSVTVAPGASLDFNNRINLNGNTLTTSGTVRINHSTIGGGAVMSSGALVANGVANIGGDLVSTGALIIGVGAQGADAFAVQGDAVLSGILDIEWDLSTVPTTPMTIVSVGGLLDASGLSLAAEDARAFALSSDGNSLTLTFLGAAVPEPATAGVILSGFFAAAVWRSRNVRRFYRPLFAIMIVLTASAASVSAQTGLINFESPTYSTGNLIGQNGWVQNNYVLPANVNGTVAVSSDSPLFGSQSLLYSQTSAPGGFAAADVSKPYVAFGKADGTTAIDLTASVRMQAGPSTSPSFPADRIGVFLSAVAVGGTSPVAVILNGGTIETLHTTGFFAAGAYTPNNVMEFHIGVNFDDGDYEVSYRDITADGPLTPLVGPLPNGRFGYFDNPNNFPADGDGVTRTVDVGLFLRGGVGRIDEITVVGDDFIEASWNGGSGDWSQNVSWIPQLIPNAPASTNAQIAVFGTNPDPQTVFTNTTQTVNGLRFDNANKYAIAGGGSIALRANTIGGTINPTINVVSGAHELQAPVSVLNNTTVTVDSGAKLDFNNNIALGGRTLTTSGAVDINVGVTGGGSISNSGTLGTAGATPIAANLNSTGTLQIDLGAANTDFFDVTGTATLSGFLDVVLEPGYTPTGPYTVLTSTGTLDATGLALHPSDLSSFTLDVSGNSLVLTVGGSGIPGDFNNDTFVNGDDLAQWKGDFGNNANSDADGDLDSDGNDFLIWQRNVQPVPAEVASATVPEPSAALLALLAIVGWAAAVRRGRLREV